MLVLILRHFLILFGIADVFSDLNKNLFHPLADFFVRHHVLSLRAKGSYSQRYRQLADDVHGGQPLAVAQPLSTALVMIPDGAIVAAFVAVIAGLEAGNVAEVAIPDELGATAYRALVPRMVGADAVIVGDAGRT